MTSPLEPPKIGVRIAGTGMALPSQELTNQDLERVMETSDEWILQRTGISSRRVIDTSKGECTLTLARESLARALEDSHLHGTDLDLLLLATMTMEMGCPPSACRLASDVGAGAIGAVDISGACCGFVYSMNLAYGMIRSGLYRTVAVVGADTLSTYMDYNDRGRSTAILFGDGAGAVILRATDDTSRGLIAQAMHSDGSRWQDLYIPEVLDRDFPPGHEPDPAALHRVQMNGRAVFKFAVGTFPDVIAQTLDRAGLRPDEVDHYICHQSNARILEAARERFGLPPEKLYVNIGTRGNTVAASVPMCLHELREQGRVRDGQRVMFVAFGGGLTWATSLWQL
ncbi:MAG: ketoacyl-ACP synthase III [Phycisphaeraceae bacterium]|nr:ketoacyl-ACP synthase III [Phycisphaeraceae bacterium]